MVSPSIPFQTFQTPTKCQVLLSEADTKYPTPVLGANTVLAADTNFLYTGMLTLGNYLVKKGSVISLGSHTLRLKNILMKQK